MKTKIILITILLVFTNTFAQGKLDKAKENLKKTKHSFNTTSKQNTKNYRNNDNFLARVVTGIVINLTYGVVVETIFEKESKMHDASITKYPYFSDNLGNYVYADSNSMKKNRFEIESNLVVESKSLFGNNFHSKFRFAKRFDASLDYLQLFEKTPNGTDNFTQFTFLLNYHRIRTEKLDLYYGVGLTHVANSVSTTGFAYNIGAEWFVKKPISIAASYKGSFINDENVDTIKAHLKYYLKNYHFNIGYEKFSLATVDINAFSLGFGATF